MLNKKDIDYFVNELARQKSFWDRLGGKPNFKDKTIKCFKPPNIDFKIEGTPGKQ